MLLVVAAGTVAQAQPSRAAAGPAAQSAAGSSSMASAEVLKIYKSEKRLLLKHGPIPGIGMDAMTMEFGVTDRKMLNRVKPGDNIRFVAKRVGDDYFLTRVEVVK